MKLTRIIAAGCRASTSQLNHKYYVADVTPMWRGTSVECLAHEHDTIIDLGQCLNGLFYSESSC